MYLYFIKFNKILLYKLTGRESNRMDFKQEYFIVKLWLNSNTATEDMASVMDTTLSPPG